jgi:hypothetical protein
VSSTYCLPERSRKMTTSWGKPSPTSLKRLVGRQAVIKTGSWDAIWLAGAYGVVNTVSLYVEHGQETFHSIYVEASSSFPLALRISLLAAALLAALVWILRLLAKRLIRVLAGLSGPIARSILLTILVGTILFVITSPLCSETYDN